MNQCIFTRFLIYLSLFYSFLGIGTTDRLCAHETFKSGDYLNYDIYWSFLKVGQARLEFSKPENQDAQSDTLTISFTVQSNALIEKIYPVKSEIQSILLIDEMKPLYYRKNQQEGDKHRVTEIEFDWLNQESITREHGSPTNSLPLEPDTLDPLSLILSISNHNFKESPSTFTQKVTDGGSIVSIDAYYLEEQELHTKVGTFEANKITVATKELRGVFNKSPNSELYLFMSKDTPAILVKLQSKVRVGSFNAILTDGIYKGTTISKPIKRPTQKKHWHRGRFR